MLQSSGVIYARVSTDEQARPELASIKHQIQVCEKLSDKDGVPISDVITDDVTGQTLDRPGLQQLLVNLKTYTHLYVYDTTRLGRSRKVLSTIRDELKKARVTLRLVHGDTSEMDEESAIIFEGLQDSLAEAEIKKFVRRARLGREGRAKRGLMAGKIPTGWIAAGNSYEHDPAWDLFFQDLEELFLSGLPYARLPVAMSNKGHVSPNTGRSWSVTALKYMLRNPINMGTIIFGYTTRKPGDCIRYPNAYPPRWNNPSLVQAELKRRNRLKGGARKQKYRLTGILVCDHCGWKMTSQPRRWTRKDGSISTWVRYRCTKHTEYQSRRWDEDCQPNHITETKAIQQISAWLRIMADPEILDQVIEELIPENGALEKLDQIERRQSEIDRILVGLVDRMAQIPEAALPDARARMKELAQERIDLEDQARELRIEAERMEDRESYRDLLMDAAANVDELLQDAPPHEVQAGLHALFPDGIPVKDGMIDL